tara:strand:+ start:876 stop:1022 length:147 start_codon:yes stop_codon:yes gene_type:complete
VSKGIPPFRKNNIRNSKIVKEKDACIVFDKDDNILNINENYISKNNLL